jgi:hypothetical protein
MCYMSTAQSLRPMHATSVSARVLTNSQLVPVPHFADEDKRLITRWPLFTCLAARTNQKCTTRLFNALGDFYVTAEIYRSVCFFIRTHTHTHTFFMNTGLNIIKRNSSGNRKLSMFFKELSRFWNFSMYSTRFVHINLIQ